MESRTFLNVSLGFAFILGVLSLKLVSTKIDFLEYRLGIIFFTRGSA